MFNVYIQYTYIPLVRAGYKIIFKLRVLKDLCKTLWKWINSEIFISKNLFVTKNMFNFKI